MHGTTLIAIAAAAIIGSLLIFLLTGGHVIFFALPLLLGLPLLRGGRRG